MQEGQRTVLFIDVRTTERKYVKIEGKKTFLELLANDPFVYSGYKYRNRNKTEEYFVC